MDNTEKKQVEYLIVDTTAFLQNAQLQDVADKIVTCPCVVDEIKNKRQLRRLVVLPYDLEVKEVFPENIKVVTEFAKKTGDYPSLSSTDIQVLALTYQLEKERVGINHIRTEPVQSIVTTTKASLPDSVVDFAGFFLPGNAVASENQDNNLTDDDKDGDCIKSATAEECHSNNLTDDDKDSEIIHKKLAEQFQSLECTGSDEQDDPIDDILLPVNDDSDSDKQLEDDVNSEQDDDDEEGWITPSNVKVAKKHLNSQLLEEKHVTVACMTTDFAMQNVLKQMNLNISALDGRIIKQVRTFILRCYACFKTTSIMTKRFCPKCGNDTLKKVAVSWDENGKMIIHINGRKPLTGRGKKFSLPTFKGGKHPNNPIVVADQPMAENRPSRLAKTKNNPMHEDYIAGYSPFITRDTTSKSSLLGLRPDATVKNWIRKNPNEARRKRK